MRKSGKKNKASHALQETSLRHSSLANFYAILDNIYNENIEVAKELREDFYENLTSLRKISNKEHAFDLLDSEEEFFSFLLEIIKNEPDKINVILNFFKVRSEENIKKVEFYHKEMGYWVLRLLINVNAIDLLKEILENHAFNPLVLEEVVVQTGKFSLINLLKLEDKVQVLFENEMKIFLSGEARNFIRIFNILHDHKDKIDFTRGIICATGTVSSPLWQEFISIIHDQIRMNDNHIEQLIDVLNTIIDSAQGNKLPMVVNEKDYMSLLIGICRNILTKKQIHFDRCKDLISKYSEKGDFGYKGYRSGQYIDILTNENGKGKDKRIEALIKLLEKKEYDIQESAHNTLFDKLEFAMQLNQLEAFEELLSASLVFSKSNIVNLLNQAKGNLADILRYKTYSISENDMGANFYQAQKGIFLSLLIKAGSIDVEKLRIRFGKYEVGILYFAVLLGTEMKDNDFISKVMEKFNGMNPKSRKNLINEFPSKIQTNSHQTVELTSKPHFLHKLRAVAISQNETFDVRLRLDGDPPCPFILYLKCKELYNKELIIKFIENGVSLNSNLNGYHFRDFSVELNQSMTVMHALACVISKFPDDIQVILETAIKFGGKNQSNSGIIGPYMRPSDILRKAGYPQEAKILEKTSAISSIKFNLWKALGSKKNYKVDLLKPKENQKKRKDERKEKLKSYFDPLN